MSLIWLQWGSNMKKKLASFEDNYKLIYKKGIEMLKRRWTDSITLETMYVDEYNEMVP